MPSVQKGEKKNHYMHRCVPMLVKEGKSQDQAVAQCLSMFRQHWQAKGKILPADPMAVEFQELLAQFDWDECPECMKMENDIKKLHGIYEIDMTLAKMSCQCDNCKQTIDTSKPKSKKNVDGTSSQQPNPSIKAQLETGIDTGETKEYHFCDEECLRQYLNKRVTKGKK